MQWYSHLNGFSSIFLPHWAAINTLHTGFFSCISWDPLLKAAWPVVTQVQPLLLTSRRPETQRLLLRAPCVLSPAHSGLLLCVDFATWSREVSHLWRDRDPSRQQPGLTGLMVIHCEPNLGESLNLSFLIIKMGIEVPLLPKVKWDHVRVQTAMFESLLCKNYFLWKHWFLLEHLGVCLLPPSSQNCFSLSELFFVMD